MQEADLSSTTAKPLQATARIDAFDIARGVALAAMTSFHFGWDLEMFALVEPGFAAQPAMIWYARIIASSFLFLVGVSFVLAHHDGFRPASFWKRWAKIAGAAALITLATYFATPDFYIFFGILHHIALASLFAIVTARLPVIPLLGLALFVLVLPQFYRSDVFNAPMWWWTGLNAFIPRSSDYVPIFPFFAAVLAGLATGKAIIQLDFSRGFGAFMANWRPQNPLASVLRFMGRNSLAYYLLHQPVLIALLYIFTQYIR